MMQNNDKINALVCDIDGVLCVVDPKYLPCRELWKDRDAWDRYIKKIDRVIKVSVETISFVKTLVDNKLFGIEKLVFLTSREDRMWCRNKTEELLSQQFKFTNYELVMREDMDYRPCYEVKEEKYNNYIQHKFNVILAIDDTPSVCDMWRKLGVPVFHCNPFNYIAVTN